MDSSKSRGGFLDSLGYELYSNAELEAAETYAMVLEYLLENVLDPKTTAKDIIYKIERELEDVTR